MNLPGRKVNRQKRRAIALVQFFSLEWGFVCRKYIHDLKDDVKDGIVSVKKEPNIQRRAILKTGKWKLGNQCLLVKRYPARRDHSEYSGFYRKADIIVISAPAELASPHRNIGT
jgi:hypothetical protein